MKKKASIIIFIFLFISLSFANTNDLLHLYDFNDCRWIPIEYLYVIKSVDREKIKQYLPKIGDNKIYVDYLDEYKNWYDESVYEPEKLELEKKREFNKDIYILHFSFSYSYYIKKLEENNNIFLLNLEQTEASKYLTFVNDVENKLIKERNLRKTPLYSENPAYYDEEEYKFDEILIDAKFIFDGDYLTVYANEDKFKQIYFRCTEETFEQLKSLIYTNKIDLSKVTWPRHADGSCDYDGSKKTVASQAQKAASSTNVAPNKTMTVKENLKLRSGEDTSTQVLAVMSAGAKVRILELGKAETIDGIPSNWVKVEVQQGAKDRNGKPIKKGTVGWCFGGFLE
ncbi:MAG: SH3 domain-containing protein [Treponema sp.]|nr:SH3 domain-containing protein [Treponema sp.]